MRQFNQMYVNGAFVTPHGKATVDLVNPTNNEAIGKVTLADETDMRQAIAAAKKAFTSFSQTTKEVRMDYLQRLHDSVSKRVGDLVQATVLEYGAPQDRAKGSNALAALGDDVIVTLYRLGYIAAASIMRASLSQIERLRQLHNLSGTEPFTDLRVQVLEN